MPVMMLHNIVHHGDAPLGNTGLEGEELALLFSMFTFPQVIEHIAIAIGTHKLTVMEHGT